MKYIWLSSYIGSIWLANWFIGNVGSCIPDGPCVIPVGLGWSAPSGVLWIGVALFLRDLLQDASNKKWVIGGILMGAGLSAFLSPSLALASGLAVLSGELLDFAVHTPLRERSRPLAVLLSGTVGSIVDSVVFLWLAFGSLMFIEGQVLGKMEMTVLAALLVLGKQNVLPIWLLLKRIDKRAQS